MLTALVAGPTITRISEITRPYLGKLQQLKDSDDNTFEFTEEGEGPENRTSRKYLFCKGHSTRCYSDSDWGAYVKHVFGKYSPGGKTPPPKLLRSIFITTLRGSSDVTEELRASVAQHMKHQIDTQGSDHYDVEFHQRGWLYVTSDGPDDLWYWRNETGPT